MRLLKRIAIRSMAKVNNSNKAVFWDRDGVVLRDTGYMYRPEQIVFIPNVIQALKETHALGFLNIMVTNQSGVARGYFTLADMQLFHAAMSHQLLQFGVKLDAIYYCPHYPTGNNLEFVKECKCRKPGTAMLEQAASDHNINFARSYMVGDKDLDVQCAKAAGVRAIQFIENSTAFAPQADCTANDMRQVLAYISVTSL